MDGSRQPGGRARAAARTAGAHRATEQVRSSVETSPSAAAAVKKLREARKRGRVTLGASRPRWQARRATTLLTGAVKARLKRTFLWHSCRVMRFHITFQGHGRPKPQSRPVDRARPRQRFRRRYPKGKQRIRGTFPSASVGRGGGPRTQADCVCNGNRPAPRKLGIGVVRAEREQAGTSGVGTHGPSIET